MQHKDYDMTSSHSEKDIYDGCVELMEGLVEEFYDYLDFLGVDLKDYPEDEQFKLTMHPTQIVERLFLWKTPHSGGTSQIMKCRELGIDPSKDIHFTFSDYQEENE